MTQVGALDGVCVLQVLDGKSTHRKNEQMKRASIASMAVGLLAVSLALAGCRQSNQDHTASGPNTESLSTQDVQKIALGGKMTDEKPQEKTISCLHDAKLYCLGVLLYAEKHTNMCPAHLNQTLPYLRAANRLPNGTNHFEILYHGSLDKLPNPMTNGIIALRSDSWQTSDGKWVRVYGFTDGHCEAHTETNNNFAAYEKEHSLSP